MITRRSTRSKSGSQTVPDQAGAGDANAAMDSQDSASVKNENSPLDTIVEDVPERVLEAIETMETVPGARVSIADISAPISNPEVGSKPTDIDLEKVISESNASQDTQEVNSQPEVPAEVSQGTPQEGVPPSPSSLPQPSSIAPPTDATVSDKSLAPELDIPAVPSEQQPDPSEPEQVPSESAQVSSESAQVSSESAQVSSESAQVSSEPGKVPNKQGQVSSEPKKVSSEPTKVPSEQKKGSSAPKPVPHPSKSSEPQPVPAPAKPFINRPPQPVQPIQPLQHPPPPIYGLPMAPGYGPPPPFKSQGYPPIMNPALMTPIPVNPPIPVNAPIPIIPPPVQNAGEPMDINYMLAGVRAQHEADLDPFDRFKANFIGQNSRPIGDSEEPEVRLALDMNVELMNKIIQRFENSCKKSKIQKTPAAILNEITIGICPINFSAKTVNGTSHQPVHNAVMTIPVLGEFKISASGTKQEVKHKISSHICTLLHRLRQDFRRANFQAGGRNQGGQQEYPPNQVNQYQQPYPQGYPPNHYPPHPYPPYSQPYPPHYENYQQPQYPPPQQYQHIPPQNPQPQPYQQAKNGVPSPTNGVKRQRDEEMETDYNNGGVENETLDYESTVPEESLLDPVKASAIYNAIIQQSDQYLTPIMLEKLFCHMDAHQQHQLKQQELHRFQEIAGFVLENTKTNIFKTLTFATGTKCVFGEYLSLEGDTLFDCHAEVLARRALKALLMEQISLILANGLKDKDEFLLIQNGDSFELKSHLKIHLYISSPPCGDSRMFNFNERKRTERNAVSRGLLRHKVEKGQGTIPTNIKYISCWDAYLASEDRIRVMSCSDKVAMWNFMGVQGALLSNFIKPIYIESLVVTYLFRPQPLCRALFERVPKDVQSDECPLYKVNHHKVARSHRDSSMQDKNSVFSNPPSVSHIWADFKSEDNSIELVKADTGKQLLDSDESRYCKYRMSARFLRLIYEFPNKIPSTEFDSNELKDLYSRPDTNKFMKSYNYLKSLAKTYQKAKAGFIFGLHKAQLGDWNKFACDVNLFEIC